MVVKVWAFEKYFRMKSSDESKTELQLFGDELRRDVFVGAVLEWFGEVRPKDLMLAFGISMPTATRYLAAWSKRHPGLTVHRKGEHGYWKAGAGSRPTDGSPLLRFMRGQALANELASGCALELGVEFVDVDVMTEARVDGEVVGTVLGAIHRKRAVAIRYTGRQRVRDMVLSPTRLVHALGRYHVRALDHRDDTFKDIVLSRVSAIYDTSEERRTMRDFEWERFVELSFQLNPDLGADLSASVVSEWRLENDSLQKIRCREAVALYIVRHMTTPTITGQPRWLAADAATRDVALKPQR